MCLAVLYKIICLQFFICILLSVPLFCAFVSLPQSVLYDVLLLKTVSACSRNLQFLQLASAVIVTRPDQGSGTSGCAGFSSSKGSDKPVVQKTRCNSGQFYPVLSEDFCVQKIMSLKFMHIYTQDQATVQLVVAFHFTSCYNSGMFYRILWSAVVKQIECSIVTKLLEGIASRETIRFLTLRYLMISKIQRS